jgi:GT2 family glycosyltransferase
MWSGTMRHIGIREIDRGQHDTPRPVAYATGCCMLARADAIKKVGLLDEAYYMYAEDADWSLRFLRAGLAILYEPRARVWHKLSVSAGGHLSWFKLSHKERSSLRFFARYARWYHWLVLPWLHVAASAVTAARYFAARP